ncbi:hypothetical protein, partial [Prochlorococcus sp. MIT 0703]
QSRSCCWGYFSTGQVMSVRNEQIVSGFISSDQLSVIPLSLLSTHADETKGSCDDYDYEMVSRKEDAGMSSTRSERTDSIMKCI